MFNFLIWWTLYLPLGSCQIDSNGTWQQKLHQPLTKPRFQDGGGVLGWQFFPGHSHETDTCRRSSGRLEGDVPKGG